MSLNYMMTIKNLFYSLDFNLKLQFENLHHEMLQEFMDHLMANIHVTTQHPNFWVSSPWHN